MTARGFALIFGILYLGVGLLGLMPGMLRAPLEDAPPLEFDVMHGRVLGLFTVNMLHTIVHLAVGAWGLWAFMGNASPQVYARSLAVLFGVLGVMGLVPALNTVFGLMPLHGHDVWLHLGTAAAALEHARRRSPQHRGRSPKGRAGAGRARAAPQRA
jgi:hypothetical protein